MKYILSIATALILVGAGCASTPATPPTESPTVLPPTQIEQPTTNTPSVVPTTTPTANPTTTKPIVTTPVVTPPPVVVTPPPADVPPPAPTVKSYTMAEVSAANTEANCLTAINGIVYNLTAFINKHPGGDRNILRICGMDGTSAFSGQHGGESKPENMLATFDVGVLKK